MPPTLDFFGAPVMIGAVLLAIGRGTSWLMSQMSGTQQQFPWYASLLLAPSVVMIISGLAPRPLAVQLSSFMHVMKGTHSQPPEKRRFNYHLIRPGLVLGRQFTKEEDLKEVMEKHNVGAVVTLNEEWELFVPSSRVKKILGGEDNRIRFPVPDYQAPTQEQLDKIVKFMKKHVDGERKSVYVHCNAGRGRSSVVVAAYLIATEGTKKWKSASAVVRDMQRIRPTVSFALLDWPFRGQARAVATYYDRVARGLASKSE